MVKIAGDEVTEDELQAALEDQVTDQELAEAVKTLEEMITALEVGDIGGLSALLDQLQDQLANQQESLADMAKREAAQLKTLQKELEALKQETDLTSFKARFGSLLATVQGKAAADHTHSISGVTGLQQSLDQKAAKSHTHKVKEITGLQARLDATKKEATEAAKETAKTIATSTAQTVAQTTATSAAKAEVQALGANHTYINLLPDSGRFVRKSTRRYTAFTVDAFDTDASPFVPYNGSSLTEGSKYSNDNSTAGGVKRKRPALPATIVDLLKKMGRLPKKHVAGTSYHAGRYGTEFYSAKLTLGRGQMSSRSGYYLMATNRYQMLTGADGMISGAMWVRVLKGALMPYIHLGQVYVDGVAKSGTTTLTSADGWTHLSGSLVSRNAFTDTVPKLYGFPEIKSGGFIGTEIFTGTEIEIALPVLVAGKVRLPVHTAPVASFTDPESS